jgi:hypothetical protein
MPTVGGNVCRDFTKLGFPELELQQLDLASRSFVRLNVRRRRYGRRIDARPPRKHYACDNARSNCS